MRAFGLAFGEDEASLAGTDVVYGVWQKGGNDVLPLLLRTETRKKGNGRRRRRREVGKERG